MPWRWLIRSRGLFRKFLAVAIIATVATAVSLLLTIAPPFDAAMERVGDALYDAFYRSRTPESRLDGPIVIVAVDQSSIDAMAATEARFRWPWPRELWGAAIGYLESCGARVVVMDLLLNEPSHYNNETGDDQIFSSQLHRIDMPVVHCWRAPDQKSRPVFADALKDKRRLGAVNVIDDAVIRTYRPFVGEAPSLAVETLRATGQSLPSWAGEPFRLHYYGPTRRRDGTTTFRYVPAIDLIRASLPEASPQFKAAGRQLFGNKIILIGATADGTHDLKGSPVSRLYPGVEAHATAIQNLLEIRRVTVFGLAPQLAMGWLAAALAAAGALLPRTVILKLTQSLAGSALAFAIGYTIFVSRRDINWLPLAGPMLAAALAAMIGLAWTYLVEDRRRRVLLKFLSQYVSPEVASELNRRGEISLGGVRREMSVVFTDIAGFTDLSERLPTEQLESFMNLYLSEMSGVVLELSGTLDKYIGDSIMAFWNAPLDQPEHAALACRAALWMRDREHAMGDRFAEFGALNIRTRIGINSGPMVVGNLGSMQKLNYTVLGDAVNLASRLEGANKLYGSQILVAEPTVRLAGSAFLFRKLDLLRVRGRRQPMAVFELLAEGSGDEDQQKLVRGFEFAMESYQRQEWSAAETTLVALAAEFPHDGPTQMLLARVRAFREEPPPRDWDGVYEASAK